MTSWNDVKDADNCIKVLDKGFVRLVDKMGTDQSIVQAARVSYGDGTKSVREDRGLIRYLFKHKHTSPFEMVQFKFHLKVPIFVMRQLVRHRTACLTGDNILSFDVGGVDERGEFSGSHHPITIEKFYKMWHGELMQKSGGEHKSRNTHLVNSESYYTVAELAKLVERTPGNIRGHISSGRMIAERNTNATGNEPVYLIKGSEYIKWANITYTQKAPIDKNRLQTMAIRSLNEETMDIYKTNVTDIWKTGIKDVYEVALSNGKTITMTKDHLCYTDKGWLTLKEFYNFESNTPLAKMTICAPKANEPYKSFPINIGDDEEWKDIAGFDGDYQVSSYGRVKSFKFGRVTIKTHTVVKNYPVVSLQTPNKEQVVSHVHALVLDAWKGKKLNITDVTRHLNGNCQDNRPDNLVWGTEAENADDRVLHQNSTKLRGKFVNIVSVTYKGQQETYDLSVSGPFHNFVANGVIVHNSLNEYSGRYSVMTDEFYLPHVNDIKPQSDDNKQGRKGELPKLDAHIAQDVIREQCEDAYTVYQQMLRGHNQKHPLPITIPDSKPPFSDEFPGIAKELARTILPVSYYTELYWSQNLRNLFHLLNLRMDGHAQWEIQELARAMYALVEPIVPLSCEAFEDYQQQSTNLSRMEKILLHDLMKIKEGDSINSKIDILIHDGFSGSEDALIKHYNFGKRELQEFRSQWN